MDKKKLKPLVFGDKEFISLEDLDQISFDIMEERERQRSEVILD